MYRIANNVLTYPWCVSRWHNTHLQLWDGFRFSTNESDQRSYAGGLREDSTYLARSQVCRLPANRLRAMFASVFVKMRMESTLLTQLSKRHCQVVFQQHIVTFAREDERGQRRLNLGTVRGP